MIDNLGQWKPNNDYSNYSKEKWCDMDYIAFYIISEKYCPKTSLENVCYIIAAHYDESLEQHDEGTYVMIPDDRPKDEHWMLNMDDVKEFINGTGGIREFDYEP